MSERQPYNQAFRHAVAIIKILLLPKEVGSAFDLFVKSLRGQCIFGFKAGPAVFDQV